MVLEILSGLIASQLAVGALVGFLIGFGLKKLTKTVILLSAFFFGALVYLDATQYVSVNYDKLEFTINTLLQKLGVDLVIPTFLSSSFPLLTSFGVAMAVGLKKG